MKRIIAATKKRWRLQRAAAKKALTKKAAPVRKAGGEEGGLKTDKRAVEKGNSRLNHDRPTLARTTLF